MRKHARIHRRLAQGATLGVVLTGLLASSVSAVTRDVEATEDKTFDPRTVNLAVGSSVHWFGTPGGAEEHSVRQDAGLFDSGNPQTGLDFNRKFSAGTFAYHCEKHGAQGMRGVVRVAPTTNAKPAGLPFTVTWAVRGTNTGTRFDVQYRVGSGAWKSWMRNTTARSKVFGARNQPVRLQRGKSYSFRVVSRSSAAVASTISPIKSFRAS